MAKFLGLTVFLNVSNVEKSAAFYDALGFARMDMGESMPVIGYQLGTGGSLIVGPASMAEDESTKAWLAQKPWGTGTVVIPQVDDVDDIFEKAKRMGAEIEQPPTEQPWGGRMMTVVDPDGYSIIFDESWAQAKAAARPKKSGSKGRAGRSARRAPLRKAPKARSAKRVPRGKSR
ncbi:MAG: VOC family protein [Thermoplasmatota archaeon]